MCASLYRSIRIFHGITEISLNTNSGYITGGGTEKAYLTNIANIMLTMNKITDPEERKKVKVNIARFLQLYYEHPSIQKQAYVEHRMMNWADLLQQMMNPKFAFEESDLSTLLLSEAKRTAKLQEQPLTL